MLKNISQLEIQVDDKMCRFQCDSGANTVQIKEALFQFLKYIGAIEDAAKKRQEQIDVEKSQEKLEEVNCCEIVSDENPYHEAEECQMNLVESSAS